MHLLVAKCRKMDTLEIDARINVLVEQRNEAMNRIVVLAGMLATVQKSLELSQATVKELNEAVKNLETPDVSLN